jgi:hypothetical protein
LPPVDALPAAIEMLPRIIERAMLLDQLAV